MPDATPAPTKPFWQSKTVLLNVIALLSLAVPRVAQWLKENPVDVLAALAAINVIVRFATSGRVSIFSGGDDASGGSSSGAVGPFGGTKGGGSGLGTGGQDTNSKQRTPSLPWLVVVACAALLLLLPGCAALDALSADYDTKGEVLFLGEGGAKAGLRFEPGKPVAAFARVAIRDPETGKVTGFSYVEISKKAKVIPEK